MAAKKSSMKLQDKSLNFDEVYYQLRTSESQQRKDDFYGLKLSAPKQERSKTCLQSINDGKLNDDYKTDSIHE